MEKKCKFKGCRKRATENIWKRKNEWQRYKITICDRIFKSK